MKEEFKLKVGEAGAITIQNIINSNYSKGFTTPDCNGERFDKMMKSLKVGDVIIIKKH